MPIGVRMCIHVCAYVYKCVYVYVYECVYLYMYVFCILCMFVCVCVCLCMNVHLCMCVHVPVCVCTCFPEFAWETASSRHSGYLCEIGSHCLILFIKHITSTEELF